MQASTRRKSRLRQKPGSREDSVREAILSDDITIQLATPADAREIADLHLQSRRQEMPYLQLPHTDDEVRDWFGHQVGLPREAWWTARSAETIVGYALLRGEHLDHLYVLPTWKRRGVGLTLLGKVRQLSPERVLLSVFQRNTNARGFYEANGFRIVGYTDGLNEENEPDIQYVWEPLG